MRLNPNKPLSHGSGGLRGPLLVEARSPERSPRQGLDKFGFNVDNVTSCAERPFPTGDGTEDGPDGTVAAGSVGCHAQGIRRSDRLCARFSPRIP